MEKQKFDELYSIDINPHIEKKTIKDSVIYLGQQLIN